MFKSNWSQHIQQQQMQQQQSFSDSTTKSDTRQNIQESFEEAPFWAAFITYLGYLILNIFGWFRDSMRYFGFEEKKGAIDNNPLVSLTFFFNRKFKGKFL